MRAIYRRIKLEILANRNNRIIKKYRYVHLMFNDKFNKPFVDFLNRNFDVKEHLVLCKKFHHFPFPEGENVIEIKSLLGFDFSKAEKLICHSLFDGELVDYLYNHQDILTKKAYWQIWGGDLYEAPRDEKNDFVRKNCFGYLTIEGDRLFLEKKYNTDIRERVYSAGAYTFPVTLEMVNNAKDSLRPQDSIVIQINNSCDKSTLEILDTLSRFKDENIIVKTVLSYANLDFKEPIIQKGKEIFGEKFKYIDTILSPADYAKYISENNILILNQNRQQGVGNSYLAL